MNIFKSKVYNFKLDNELKIKLPSNLILELEYLTFPVKIIQQQYEWLTAPTLLKNELILAYTKNEKTKNYLYINLDDFSVNHRWDYPDLKDSFFLNSSLTQLHYSLITQDFFINSLIQNESLGAYYDNTPQGGNFEKYAELLKELIFDIDERATLEGAWCSLIQEMSMGVV